MNGFAGLCVGGPNAGVLHVSETRTFKTEERVRGAQRIRLMTNEEPVTRHPVHTKTHIYYRHQIGSVGLWIHGSMTIDEALQEIASAYEREQAAVRQVSARGGEAPEPGRPDSG